MNTKEIAGKIEGKILSGTGEEQATNVYVGDLLSDVMGHAGDECVLVTIQNHLNTIAVCTLVRCQVVVLCHNRPAPPDMIEGAAREEVAIISTAMSQYEVALALSSLPPSPRQ